MAGNSSNERITLEELAAGTLPKKLTDAIADLELTAAEVMAWERTKRWFRIIVTDESVRVQISFRLRYKKPVTLVTVVGAILWFISSHFALYWTELLKLIHYF